MVIGKRISLFIAACFAIGFASAAAVLGPSCGFAAYAGIPESASPTIHDGPSAPARAWRTAMEASDLAALARMHDASTITFPPDKMKVAGADAIMRDYSALFARYSVHVTFDEAHWCEQGPLVVSWGRSTLILHPKAGGADMVTHTRFTDAAVKTAGGWRYIVDHASVLRP